MSQLTAMNVPPESFEAAREAGLRYVTDEMPGIRRRPRGKGFVYVDQKGKIIQDNEVILRIQGLVIPPAWTDVWICPLAHGHIQAVGRDARGRKQYRYHPRWREVRDATKFERMLDFGKALPKIRRRIGQDLARSGLPREKVLATVLALMERTLIRVGNEEYAEQNDSYGLTTMKDRHADISGSTIRFHFRGKSGKEHEVKVNDRHLAKIVRECQELPGYELFQYIDEDGERRTIDSDDVNQYLKEITGEDFTAKDYRTWGGTVLFVEALRRMDPCHSKTQAKRQLIEIVKQVSHCLRNTPTVCKKFYIHPAFMERFLDMSLPQVIDRVCELQKGRRQIRSERLVMILLEQLEREKRAASRRKPLVSVNGQASRNGRSARSGSSRTPMAARRTR